MPRTKQIRLNEAEVWKTVSRLGVSTEIVEKLSEKDFKFVSKVFVKNFLPLIEKRHSLERAKSRGIDIGSLAVGSIVEVNHNRKKKKAVVVPTRGSDLKKCQVRVWMPNSEKPLCVPFDSVSQVMDEPLVAMELGSNLPIAKVRDSFTA